ncbi:hypothetical protein_gp112 [Bacillus phage vB_BceM_WH1]|nr:hypothetical protein_gp112 [Bacillus phage vB_BceM_WH1]
MILNIIKWKGLDVDPAKLSESTTIKANILNGNRTALQESTSENGMRYLLPRIEAIHAGSTRNYTRYPAEKLRGHEELKSGLYSWTKPYAKPVIFNHDHETEVTGRVQSAVFSEFTASGRPGLIVTPKITHEKAIDDILGGRLLTVSIGASTDACTCSVCGTDIINEGFCGHWKGEVHDGITTEWIVGNVYFDELSWVNVPADQDAMIIEAGQTISTAEAFMGSERQLIDLSRPQESWQVSEAEAKEKGLIIEKTGGVKGMTIEELKAKVEELNTNLAEANTQKQELENKVTELEASVTEATEKVTALEEANATLETEKATLVEEKSTLEAEKTQLEEAKTQAEEALTEANAAKEELTAQQESLGQELHTQVVERVVDMRVLLGKESSREEAIDSYKGRTMESLKDTLADLAKESVVVPTNVVTPAATRVVEGVQNPGSSADPNDPGAKQVAEGITPENALKTLFGGNIQKMKK